MTNTAPVSPAGGTSQPRVIGGFFALLLSPRPGFMLGTADWLGQTPHSDNTPMREKKTMTRSISYQQSTIVDLPADEVWAHVADYAFDLEWRNGLTDMTPYPQGPPETGTTVHEELRSMGTTMVNDTTITKIGDHAYRFVGGGASGQVEGGRKVVAIDPGHSEFTYDINLTLNGPTRFFGPILGPILRRNLGKDLQRFRALVEAAAVPVPDCASLRAISARRP